MNLLKSLSFIAPALLLTIQVACRSPSTVEEDASGPQFSRYGEVTVTFSDSVNDQRLKRELDDWYQQQISQDSTAQEPDQGAIDAVQRAFKKVAGQSVYGPVDPFRRSAGQLPPLRTKPNPKGGGTVVWGWQDHNKAGSADWHRERFIWLVLDDTVYPLHTNASLALGLLFDGVPESVQKKAGLVHTYERGKTILDQLGFEEHSFKRFQAGSGGNPFPQCQ